MEQFSGLFRQLGHIRPQQQQQQQQGHHADAPDAEHVVSAPPVQRASGSGSTGLQGDARQSLPGNVVIPGAAAGQQAAGIDRESKVSPAPTVLTAISRAIAQDLPEDVHAVRLLWSDSAGLRRCRVVPSSRYKEVSVQGVGVTFACMAQPSHLDSPAPNSGLTAVGEARLMPVDSTRVRIPWCPGHMFVMGDFVNIAGRDWPCCPRRALRYALGLLKLTYGLQLKVGFELEFMLFETAPPGSTGTLYGTQLRPVDNARYCQASGVDQQAKVLDEMVLALEQMEIGVVQYHTESGPGQYEIATQFCDALQACDKLLLSKEAVCAIARKHGLYACFLPKPVKFQAGNGLHCHMSLWKDGAPVMDGSSTSSPGMPLPSETAQNFIAGVLRCLEGLLPFTAPSPNSYERFKPGGWAGAYTVWGWNNREAPIRVTAPTMNNLDMTHFEYKAMDATANPHIAIAVILVAGMLGMDSKSQLPDMCVVPPETLDAAQMAAMGAKRFPASLADALAIVQSDNAAMLRGSLAEVFGEELLNAYLAVRRAEADFAAHDNMADQLLRYS